MAKLKKDDFLGKKVSFENEDGMFIAKVIDVDVQEKTVSVLTDEGESFDLNIKGLNILEEEIAPSVFDESLLGPGENEEEIAPEIIKPLISKKDENVKLVNLVLAGKYYNGYDEGLSGCVKINVKNSDSIDVSEKFAKRIMVDFKDLFEYGLK